VNSNVSQAENTARSAAIEHLRWLVEMGADEVTLDDPVDRFKVTTDLRAHKDAAASNAGHEPDQGSERRSGPGSSGPGSGSGSGGVSAHAGVSGEAAPARAPASGEDTIQDAREIAESCTSLEEISAALDRFDACALKRTASNLCYIDGNRQARTMLIGEAPGRDEDIQGKPFVGRSGRLLDKMLAAIGLSREETGPAKAVFISNVIFWRPPGNRKPTEAETLICMPFVKRTIELTDPEFIVCLGATPTQRLIGRTEGILKLRGRWFTLPLKEREIPLLATLHPAYLLRQPAQKRLAWRDLLALKQRLETG